MNSGSFIVYQSEYDSVCAFSCFYFGNMCFPESCVFLFTSEILWHLHELHSPLFLRNACWTLSSLRLCHSGPPLPIQFSSVESLSCVWLFATPWPAAHQASLSFTTSRSLLKLMSIESVMPSNHLILCRPLLLPPSIFPSIRVLSNESVLHIRWPKYWSFSFSISPSDEYSGLISFRVDWLDLLEVQGTHESSPTSQFKSTNSSALSFLYSPNVRSIYDYWKNHSFD